LRHHSSYRSLTIALDRRLWRDPTHLQPPTGALVLVATKGAGNKLHDLLRDRRSLYQGKLSQLRCTKQANVGINRRAINAGSGKLSLKGELMRVRFNDWLARRPPPKFHLRQVSR